MSFQRSIRLIARWVLISFALSLGVAIASPMVKPRPMELICTGAGIMKLVASTGDGSIELVNPTLDCPMCANLGAPPSTIGSVVEPVFDLASACMPLEAARIASLLRGPWQARAPPVFS
ncbi:MAG: DUF2946 domain-containing protein [Burkholderiaceae bacterium]|nr:DUF2946 domain-containing protein [Burkholderiaceae bacterium]MDO9196959.1 DUF2946 domain-containing protein [Rhodoferax sp.]